MANFSSIFDAGLTFCKLGLELPQGTHNRSTSREHIMDSIVRLFGTEAVEFTLTIEHDNPFRTTVLK